MEEWQRDFEWLRVRHMGKDMMGKDKLPDLQSILFLIGIQELGKWEGNFTKEEKQDLMHIATCRLLEGDGFYTFKGRDQDGWPHYDQVKKFNISGVKQQETFLIEKMIEYFNLLEAETPLSTYNEEE